MVAGGAQTAGHAHSCLPLQSRAVWRKRQPTSPSQPSVSKAIADVEHVLGLRLFDRGPRGIEPTIYGRAPVNCGTAVFDELRQGVKQLEFLVDPTAGELRVGCNETLAAGFVSAVVEQLSRQYPRVAVHVVPANREVLLARELPQRTIDLALHRYPD